LALFFVAPNAHAARKIKWTKVETRAGKDAKRLSLTFRKLLKKKSRRAKWGKGASLELSAKVVTLDWEESEEVLRIRIVVVAKIAGGKTARSKIRIGGRPNERRKLEKQALKIVSDGLVVRLATIARGD
jgi:hypothetical protein